MLFWDVHAFGGNFAASGGVDDSDAVAFVDDLEIATDRQVPDPDQGGLELAQAVVVKAPADNGWRIFSHIPRTRPAPARQAPAPGMNSVVAAMRAPQGWCGCA